MISVLDEGTDFRASVQTVDECRKTFQSLRDGLQIDVSGIATSPTVSVPITLLADSDFTTDLKDLLVTLIDRVNYNSEILNEVLKMKFTPT